jgi:hypothetical protein
MKTRPAKRINPQVENPFRKKEKPQDQRREKYYNKLKSDPILWYQQKVKQRLYYQQKVKGIDFSTQDVQMYRSVKWE